MSKFNSYKEWNEAKKTTPPPRQPLLLQIPTAAYELIELARERGTFNRIYKTKSERIIEQATDSIVGSFLYGGKLSTRLPIINQ